MSARVVFVGAGPGAADLLTLRGLQRLAQADAVLADALTDPALRALAPRAHWIDVGKRGFGESTPQAEIDRLLVQLAQTHACVVRLKGGDPGLFGRLEEELQALAEAGIEAEVVPGVTAACAAAADAQRPLTRRGRGRSVALCTAMGADGLVSPARQADTEVHYMAGRQLPRLQRALREAGWDDDAPVLVVSRAGCADRMVTAHRLAGLAAAGLVHGGRPTVVTIGEGAREVGALGRDPGMPARASAAAAGPATAAAPAAPPAVSAMPKP